MKKLLCILFLISNLSFGQVSHAPVSGSGAGSTPPGTILAYGGATAPTGWLLCDGTSYLRTTYPNLSTVFACSGSSCVYGAVDTTHFNTPDLRGQFLRGSVNTMGGTITALPGSNNATITGHNFNHSGIPVQITGTPPTGLSTSTNYYIIYIDANTVAFASSLANSFTSTKISISGSASGTVIQIIDPNTSSRQSLSTGGSSTGLGSAQLDSFQGHIHNAFTSPAGGTYSNDGSILLTNTSPTSFTPQSLLGQFTYPFMTTPVVDAAGDGTPRFGSETRPINVYVNYIIKY